MVLHNLERDRSEIYSPFYTEQYFYIATLSIILPPSTYIMAMNKKERRGRKGDIVT